MERGRIVCSKAGSDKGRFFAVVGIDGKSVLVCDGKRYKLSAAKRKNPKHLGVTSSLVSEEQLLTDKALRKALAVFRDSKEENECQNPI